MTIFSALGRYLRSTIKFFFPIIAKTGKTAAPITVFTYFMQKVVGFNRDCYWPVHFTSTISGVPNIKIGIGTAPGLSPGCYIQGIGTISIGDYTIIAPNVGIISANHSTYKLKEHIPGKVIIGSYCWLGMNSVVLPNVVLGDFTIVAAGAVVTKSFPHGYCVVAGNPARQIKNLDPQKCVRYENEYKYYGYIDAEQFKSYRHQNLKV